MKSRAKNTMKRVLSWTLIVTLMLTFMPLIEYPLNAAGITNNTVQQAVLDKYPGATPNDNVKVIDISNKPNVIGTLDLAQIMVDYPNVGLINITNTNITDVINSAAFPGTIMCNGTFVNHSSNTNPRALVPASKEITYNLETDTNGINLNNLINGITVNNIDTLKSDLIDSLKSVTIDTTPITPVSIGTYGAISHTDLQLSADTYTLVLEFEFKNVESTWTYKLEYDLVIKDVSLVADPSAITAHQGGKVSFTISKLDNNDDPIQLNPADLSIPNTLFELNSLTMVKSGKSVLVEGIIATSTAIGPHTLTVTDTVSGKTVDIDIEVESLVSINTSLDLFEQNGNSTSQNALAGTVYIKGGTAISSETQNKAMTTYTNSTVYLLENNGTPLSDEYIDVLQLVDASGNLTGEFISVNSQAALRITAAPTDVTKYGTFTIKTLSGIVATTGPINYEIIPGLAQKYKVFMVDSTEYPNPTNLQDIINNSSDPYVTEIDEFTKSGSGWEPVSRNTATMLEEKPAYFVIGVQYGTDGPYYLASAGSITDWYETGSPNISFSNAPVGFRDNDKMKGATRITAGSVTTKVLDVDPTLESGNNGTVKVGVQITVGGTIPNTLEFFVEVEPRKLSHYEFRTTNGYLLTSTDSNIPIGTSKDYTIVAVYDNGSVVPVNFSTDNLTVEYLNNMNGTTELFPSGTNPSALISGNTVTFKATDKGGANDYIAGSTVTVTVTKDGKTGTIQLTLTNSLINGVTYYVQTPEGIFDYDDSSIELKNTWSKDQLELANNGVLEIPRGLDAHVWIVPTFTNSTMYNKDIVSDWSLYAIQTSGITNPSTVGAPTFDITTDSYVISTFGNVTEPINSEVIYTFPISSGRPINGAPHDLLSGTVDTTLKVKITDPIVTEIIPQKWNPVTKIYDDLTPTSTGYATVGKVGEELKLRLRVVYSDGKSVDILGPNNLGTYENGTYFIPLENVDTYLPTVGYTQSPADLLPNPLSDFGAGTDAEMSVIYGRFMSRIPAAYRSLVNPVGSPPPIPSGNDWNNGFNAGEIHDELVKLTKEIEIHNITQATPTTDPTGITAGYLMKNGSIVPGHYSIKLLATGEYEVDFSGIYTANGFNDKIFIDNSIIKITTGLPTIEKVYLVSDDLAFDSYDSTNNRDLYEFERSSLNIENGYNVFYVYPMFLDSSYYINGTTLPDRLSDPNDATQGISKVLAAEWANGSIGTWTSSDPGVLKIEEEIDNDGYLRLKVTVLSIPDIDKTSPITISLALNLVQASGTTDKYDLTPPPADPTDMAIFTTSQVIVQDIEVGTGYTSGNPGQIATQIQLGETIYFPVKYRISGTNVRRSLKPIEYPNQANSSNVPGKTNVLVLGESNLPGAYDLTIDGTTGDFKFVPYALGTYTFYLSTTNIDGAPIPALHQGDRIITFEVVAPTISQDVYFGETVPMDNLPLGWTSITENVTSLLDTTALSNGRLEMKYNSNDTAIVHVKDSSGKLLAIYNLTLTACTVEYKLIPVSSMSSWFKFAPNEEVGTMWEITYRKPDLSISFVDHAPVTSIALDPGSPHDFLTLNNSTLKAIPDGTDDPQYGIYTATDPDGTDHTLYAMLNLSDIPRSYAYELHDSNTGTPNVITRLSLTVGDKQNVYVFDTINNVYIHEFTLANSNTAVVNETHKGGYALIEATAAGTATITFTPILSGDSLTLTVSVDAPPVVTYTISGTVTKAGTSDVLQGAAVELFDSTNNSKGTDTTDINGQYNFTNVPNGVYTVKVTLNGYNDGSKNGTVNGSNITIDIALVPLSVPVYTIEGQITDSDTGSGIGGASVKLSTNPNIDTVTADGNGNYKFTVVPNGTYTVEASATGYNSNSTTTTVSDANETNVDIELDRVPAGTYTISGTITDATTSAPIIGATVELSDSTNPNITTTTDVNGNYTFNSVVNGTYTVEASATGYNPNNTTIGVNDANETNVNIALVPYGVYSYTIEGQITDSDTGLGIGGATVKLSTNPNITTTTDVNGNYTFNSVVNGTYTVEASATGYNPNNTTIVVNDANETNVNIALDPTSVIPNTYKISGKIKNTSGFVVVGATVTLTDGTSIIATTKANILGFYSFKDVPNGSYIVEASAMGYTSNSDSVDVYNGNATLDITLQSSITLPDIDTDLCSALIVLSQNPIKVGEYAIATISTLNFGDDLTYVWTNSSNSVATLSGSGISVKLTGVKPGTTTITCTVSDGTNTAIATVELRVNATTSSIGNTVVLPVIVPGLGTYTVTYDSQGGSSVNKLTNVTTGAKITAPVPPTRDGYTFDGWYKEATCTNVWDFNTDTVTKDITLYAKWTKVEAKPEVVKEPEKEVTKPVTEPVKPIVTETHSAYISGYGNNKFGPDDNITRAEATQIFYNLLSDSDKASTATKSFTDVDSGAWYYKAVSVMAGLGIATGVTEDKFDPETPITREDFTAMAVRFAGLAPISGSTGFSDVSESDALAGYIKAAVNAGYILGYSDKTFKPKNEITRAEAVTIVNRVLVRVPDKGYINASLSKLTTFDDVTTAHWGYYEILEAANTHKYIKEDSKTEEWID